MVISEETYIASARRTITIEKEAIEALHDDLDENFSKVCQLLMQCKGRIIITGVGKSGHIGRKIAATLASTGTPAFFVHAGEASHGDMGMITGYDVIIAVSYSGRTEEVIRLLPLFKRVGAPVISITGNRNSVLAKEAEFHLYAGVKKEACPLNLAPTSSTTATLVMGDALAIALLEARGFTREDFALSHPAGNLGARLLLKVDDIMHENERLPVVPCGTLLSYALLEMSSKRLGMTAVCDVEGRMVGVFTDGDLRRAIDQHTDPRTTPIDEVMTRNFIAISSGMLAAEALNIMQKKQINGLFCIDDKGHPVGAFNMLDLVNAGIL
ncbi:MAG: KpsF/GutQ family sugar-phosphate isomerase [Endozoicomonadaceae bacterium]|nr:KpsF/GutQ family sugar-phosphate isomerase [Endozoicomonadaceae bacterium]